MMTWEESLEDEKRVLALIKDTIPWQPQVQYSLNAQLIHLKFAANRLGLYDAADFITQALANSSDR